MGLTLSIKKFKQSGDMAHEYNPFKNIKLTDSEKHDKSELNGLVDFTTDEIKCYINNPVNIQCQPSYDGTVNLIINDNKNPSRLINSRFSVTENNTYRIVNRNQQVQTNIYHEGTIDAETRLFKNVKTFPIIDLMEVSYSGQLMGGNYVFYIKYCDDDNNETDFVSESGIVQIFHGTFNNLSSIYGALANENTNKSINFKISNLDTTYYKFNVYFSRDTSDINGTRITRYYKINESYDITGEEVNININGYEETTEIISDDLNIQYNIVESVKSQTQVQNMLFFANVEKNVPDVSSLQTLSLYARVYIRQKEKSLQWCYTNFKNSTDKIPEYYNPNNTYYYLGYWPNEIYRLGVVYIYNDDSLSPVFNLRGIQFTDINQCNYNENSKSKYWFKTKTTTKQINNQEIEWTEIEKDEDGEYILNNELEYNDIIKDETNLMNTYGVFKLPNIHVLDHLNTLVKPLYFEISFPKEILAWLHDHNIKGYFFVRQKRIPIILGQALTIGVDKYSYIPCLYINNFDAPKKYISESPLNTVKGDKNSINYALGVSYPFSARQIFVSSTSGNYSGLLSLEFSINPYYRSLLDGSNFTLQYDTIFNTSVINNNIISYSSPISNVKNELINTGLLYIDSDVPTRSFQDKYFSTRKGSDLDKQQVAAFGIELKDFKDAWEEDIDNNDGDNYMVQNRHNYIRGIYTDFIGCNTKLNDAAICNIMISNYSDSFIDKYFNIRGNDRSSFFAISNRFYTYGDDAYNRGFDGGYKPELNEKDEITGQDFLLPSPIKTTDIYRGDCYSCTVAIRMNRNFIDSYNIATDDIVDPYCWQTYYKGSATALEYDVDDKSKGGWNLINISDLNTSHIGHWVVFKCLSNTNLGLRSIDSNNVEEVAKMGNERKFYPLRGPSVKNAEKIADSILFNNGYGSTLGVRQNFVWQDVPYTRDVFDTRIMFSNIQENNSFKNAYRIFQGLSYQDIDNQYGSITKILQWGSNLLAVFEHGIGIVPVNEKALMSTQSGQSIHLYGAGVLQQQISVCSADYGTIWHDSIIRTDVGIYGVDTYAKKIWRITQNNGLELLSDFKIQRYLNDHISLKELDKFEIMALRNVVSHYNKYKGDVIFTFYNYTEDEEWSICFNERINKFVTRYSWVPLLSENIDNVFYTLDKKRAEPLALIFNQTTTDYGIVSHEYILDAKTDSQNNYVLEPNNIVLNLKGMDFYDYYNLEIQSIESAYIDPVDNIERKVVWTNNVDISKKFDESKPLLIWTPESQIDNWDIQLNIGYEQQDSIKLNIDNKIYYPINTIFNLQLNEEMIRWYNSDKTEYQTLLYWIVNIRCYTRVKVQNPSVSTGNVSTVAGNTFDSPIVLLINANNINANEELVDHYERFMTNGVFVHGRSGIFDEINYKDKSQSNNITPTKWFNKQEPFEFEFIVTQPVGMQKIFNNLVIISNNAEPDSLEIEIVGDAYNFDKYGIYWYEQNSNDDTRNSDYSQKFENVKISWDNQLNQYGLVINQKLKNIRNKGRIVGNIEYKEDCWNITLTPIRYRKLIKLKESKKIYETRIRDKYAKIRVKYKGDKLVLITAIKSLYTLSYA